MAASIEDIMNRYSLPCLPLLALLALLALWAACGGEEAPTPADDGCEHMINGPSDALAAIAEPTGDAPDMVEHHVRYEITLAGDAAPYGGHVDLIMDEQGQFAIFVSPGVPLTVLDSSGEDVPPEAIETDVKACAEVSAGYTFELGVGTYRLSLGPSEEPEVQVVVVDVAGDIHE
jgi:hypothetical protein